MKSIKPIATSASPDVLLSAVKSAPIPDALRNFDFLPDAAIVRDKVVAGLFGCSVPTVWRMARDGRIPKPVKPSLRVTGWRVGGLREALNKC